MAKQGKLQAAMQDRSPLAQRQAIVPVNILEAAALTPSTPSAETERKNDAEKTVDLPVREERTQLTNAANTRKERMQKPSIYRVRQNRTILAEPEKPETVRDSYEAYVDQLETIETLRALYRKKTGRPLSKSRIIREALANFLPLALDAYKDEQKVEQVIVPSPVTPAPVVKKQPVEVEADTPPAAAPHDDLVSLQSFADLHAVNRNEAMRLWSVGMITGNKQGTGQQHIIMLAANGRRDFWVQFHETQGFRGCDLCPHK